MRQIPEELLMAYVDGELDAQARLEVERAIATDPLVAARVDRHRALRTRLRSSYNGILQEPVPERLLRSARGESGRSEIAQVIDLARVRAQRAKPAARNFSLPRWATVAASVVLGVTAGLLLQRLSSNDALTEYRGGTLLARGALARSLTEQLGGAAGGAGPVQAGLSFRAKTNDYCRTFVINDAKALAGLACRDGNDWQVVALTGLDSVPDRSQAYRMATSALPAPLLQAVNQRLSGEALDAQAEAAARARGWH